jgi:hypothetical protein
MGIDAGKKASNMADSIVDVHHDLRGTHEFPSKCMDNARLYLRGVFPGNHPGGSTFLVWSQGRSQLWIVPSQLWFIALRLHCSVKLSYIKASCLFS